MKTREQYRTYVPPGSSEAEAPVEPEVKTKAKKKVTKKNKARKKKAG